MRAGTSAAWSSAEAAVKAPDTAKATEANVRTLAEVRGLLVH
jgi:hypothetical protein